MLDQGSWRPLPNPSMPTLMQISPSPNLSSVTEQQRIQQGVLKSREKQRLNNLKILQFDSKDHQLVHETKVHVDSFITSLNMGSAISESQILQTLQQAHIASDGYYNITNAQQWNTTFEFPPEAIAADAALLKSCAYDFTLMCRRKQEALAHNRLSLRRVIETFGPLGTKIPGMLLSDFHLLSQFAQHGITPPVGTDFTPQNVLPPLRSRYLTLKHTVNSLLFKQWGDGTMALLTTDQAPGRLQRQAGRQGDW